MTHFALTFTQMAVIISLTLSVPIITKTPKQIDDEGRRQDEKRKQGSRFTQFFGVLGLGSRSLGKLQSNSKACA